MTETFPHDRVQELFYEAIQFPVEEREAFLDARCAGEPTLRAELEGLLSADASCELGIARMLLKSPVVRTPAPEPERVGRYRIVRRIAEGGMGTVYEAEQEYPRRRVALKVVRAGLSSTALHQRFRDEAQILGRLHHPGIAQVYDADLTDDGRPFFVMEFVVGEHLNEFSRRRSLSVLARLELLARVCDAVQHAHDQRVVHRDLKPANILVEASGQPKVLDFGVARVLDADRITAASLTQTGQLLGTLNYMSPEQLSARAPDVDHRADVYSLGVLSYELLAERLPRRLEDRPFAEAARLILEEDPPRLGLVVPALRGDVETIVTKALEKEPARRYASAADLAADLRRHAAHEPILARPPSAFYHLRKFTGRNKAVVGGVAATLAALILGAVGTALFAVREARQGERAEQNAQAALDGKHEAESQTYRARMAAALAALSTHDVNEARRQLDACPEELRNWEWRHVQSRLDDSSSVLPLSEGARFVTGAPDRLLFATFDRLGVHLMDLEGRETRSIPLGARGLELAGPIDAHCQIYQTRLGLRVARWIGPRSIELSDESGRLVCLAAMPNAKQPESVVISPDGRWLASHWDDGGMWRRIAVFDALSGELQATCEGHLGGIWDLAFSPDSARLASAGDDSLARLWDPTSGALLATCRGHTAKVLNVSFRPDNARLVTTSTDGTVRQWITRTGEAADVPYDRHTGEVTTAVFSPDGRWVASSGTDRTIRVWRSSDRQDIAVLHGHTGVVTHMAFEANGRQLASMSDERFFAIGDRTLRVWNVTPETPLPQLRGHTSYVYPVAFSPDGRWIASGGWDKTVRLWDAATGDLCATLPHPGVVLSLAYSPDGTWLVTGNHGDSSLMIWDAATASLLKRIRVSAGWFRFLTVSPDGNRIATTEDSHQGTRMEVYDVASGALVFSAALGALAYSPDGRWLAVQNAEHVVLLLDAADHTEVRRLEGREGAVRAATFSPDSRLLASCSVDKTVRLWRIDTGACQILRGHSDEVFAAAFHPDGTRLATAGRDRAICLWDVSRGEEVARLTGHTNYVWSLAFSPDGATLASGSGDTTVRLWDTAPLKVRHRAQQEVDAARQEAMTWVEHLFAELHEPATVVSSVLADMSRGESLRRVALQEVLRRAGRP